MNSPVATLVPDARGTPSWYRVPCFLGRVAWLAVELFCRLLEWIWLVVRSLSKVLLKMLSVFEFLP